MPLGRYYTLSNLYTLINLFVLSFVIYSGVHIFYTLAGSKVGQIEKEPAVSERTNAPTSRATKRSFDHYASAINRGLFGKAEKTIEDPKDISLEDLAPTALKVALLGTVSGDEKTARAIIQDKTKRSESLYKQGDTVQGAQILKILRGKVVLQVGDENQILTMEDEASPSRSGPSRPATQSLSPPRAQQGTTITLDRAVVNKSLENVTELLSQVRVRPHYKDGNADGLMLSQIKPNTIFTRLGLRNGDIIQNIGGNPIESPDEIMGLYEELKSGSSVSLGIQRRGQQKVLNYAFR